MSENKISQKDAVVQAVVEVMGDEFIPYKTHVAIAISNEQKKKVRARVFNMITEGLVDYKGNIDNSQKLKNYVSGMVSNYFRKTKVLNTGIVYCVQNPGSGRGKNDAKLLTLRKLLTKYETGTEEFDKITVAITEREEAIITERAIIVAERKNKKKLKNININVLPSELHDLVESV